MLAIICCVKLLTVDHDICNLTHTVACSKDNLFTLVNMSLRLFVSCLII